MIRWMIDALRGKPKQLVHDDAGIHTPEDAILNMKTGVLEIYDDTYPHTGHPLMMVKITEWPAQPSDGIDGGLTTSNADAILKLLGYGHVTPWEQTDHRPWEYKALVHKYICQKCQNLADRAATPA
jgi:hypothetical protein